MADQSAVGTPVRRSRARPADAAISWAWLGVVPVLRLRAAVPDPADALPDRRRVPGRRTATSRSTTSPISSSRRSSAPTGSASRSALASAIARRASIGFFLAYAVVARRPAALAPADADDLLAASPRTSPACRSPSPSSRRSGRTGLVTVLLDQVCSASTSTRTRLQPPQLLGPDAHLSLLPDPADGPDPDAGARRAEAGVARGRRDPRREHAGNTGATSRCRCCGRASSAPRILLFANAFGAIATAYALTGSLAQHRARSCSTRRSAATCSTTRNLGYALALGMIVITGLSNVAYIWLRARSERWLR